MGQNIDNKGLAGMKKGKKPLPQWILALASTNRIAGWRG
jgi:hypothetical protein